MSDIVQLGDVWKPLTANEIIGAAVAAENLKYNRLRNRLAYEQYQNQLSQQRGEMDFLMGNGMVGGMGGGPSQMSPAQSPSQMSPSRPNPLMSGGSGQPRDRFGLGPGQPGDTSQLGSTRGPIGYQSSNLDLDTEITTRAMGIGESGMSDNPNFQGDNGTSHGRYQYQSGTWKTYSSEYNAATTGKSEPLPNTTANQDAVTKFKVRQWLQNGYNPQQIAAMWAGGEKRPDWVGRVGYNSRIGVNYNVPANVDKFTRNYNQMASAQGLPTLGDPKQPGQTQVANSGDRVVLGGGQGNMPMGITPAQFNSGMERGAPTLDMGQNRLSPGSGMGMTGSGMGMPGMGMVGMGMPSPGPSSPRPIPFSTSPGAADTTQPSRPMPTSPDGLPMPQNKRDQYRLMGRIQAALVPFQAGLSKAMGTGNNESLQNYLDHIDSIAPYLRNITRFYRGLDMKKSGAISWSIPRLTPEMVQQFSHMLPPQMMDAAKQMAEDGLPVDVVTNDDRTQVVSLEPSKSTSLLGKSMLKDGNAQMQIPSWVTPANKLAYATAWQQMNPGWQPGQPQNIPDAKAIEESVNELHKSRREADQEVTVSGQSIVGMAESMQNGKLAPSQVKSSYRSAHVWPLVMGEVRKKYPDFDFELAEANAKWVESGKSAAMLSFANSILPRFSAGFEKVAKLGNTKIPLVNRSQAFIANEMKGDPRYHDYLSWIQSIVQEANTVLSGSSTGSDFRVKMDLEALKQANSPMAIYAAMINYNEALLARRDTAAKQWPLEVVRGEKTPEEFFKGEAERSRSAYPVVFQQGVQEGLKALEPASKHKGKTATLEGVGLQVYSDGVHWKDKRTGEVLK